MLLLLDGSLLLREKLGGVHVRFALIRPAAINHPPSESAASRILAFKSIRMIETIPMAVAIITPGAIVRVMIMIANLDDRSDKIRVGICVRNDRLVGEIVGDGLINLRRDVGVILIVAGVVPGPLIRIAGIIAVLDHRLVAAIGDILIVTGDGGIVGRRWRLGMAPCYLCGNRIECLLVPIHRCLGISHSRIGGKGIALKFVALFTGRLKIARACCTY